MNEQTQTNAEQHQRGQGLVEVALFLPLLIFLLAGVVEVSNLLITQNKVTTASRLAAGYGATNLDDEDRDLIVAGNWVSSTTALEMGEAATTAVTETLDLDPNLWDIWSIYAVTNDAGTDWATFTAAPVYGNGLVVNAAEWNVISGTIRTETFNELQSVAAASLSNLEVVAAVDFHHIDTIIGLPIWQWTGLTQIQGLTVMRVGEKPDFLGCPILPITVRLEQYSAYPSNWEDQGNTGPYLFESDGVTPQYVCDPMNIYLTGQSDLPAGEALAVSCGYAPGEFDFVENPVNRFPTGTGSDGFAHPNPPPVYVNAAGTPTGTLNTSTYLANVPGVPLAETFPRTGFIFRAREQGPNGNFGWLSWDGSTSASVLRASLDFPGDFTEKYPNSQSDLGTDPDPPNPPDPVEGNGNNLLEIDEWVANSTGNVASTDPEMRFYVDTGTPAILIIYENTNGLSGENAAYQVWGFVKVKILGYDFRGNNDTKWVVFEVVGWGLSCVGEV